MLAEAQIKIYLERVTGLSDGSGLPGSWGYRGAQLCGRRGRGTEDAPAEEAWGGRTVLTRLKPVGKTRGSRKGDRTEDRRARRCGPGVKPVQRRSPGRRGGVRGGEDVAQALCARRQQRVHRESRRSSGSAHGAVLS